MSLEYTVRPISDRTPFLGKHTPSPFEQTWSKVAEHLERELWFLNARRVVIEVDVRENQLRADGMLRADASAASPAVRLAFESIHGPLMYATDKFCRNGRTKYINGATRMVDNLTHWQHNLYAISRGLEALRMVDRYGIASKGEQYAGYRAIDSAPAALTADQAIGVIASVLNAPISEVGVDLAKAIRRARALTHPDRNGGARGQWDQVEEAARVLEAVIGS